MAKTQYEIREHPASTTESPVWLVIVTSQSGRCWFVTYTGPRPTVEWAERTWKKFRGDWDPYTGTYGTQEIRRS